jgi:hypothetical protein
MVINNPKVGDILDFGEQRYYQVASGFVAQPHEYMVQLWDIGLDFEEIGLFDFLWLFMLKDLKVEDSKILFGDLDFSAFEFIRDDNTGERFLKSGDISIDDLTYRIMSDFICKVNGFSVSKPPKYLNKHQKEYALDRERTKLKFAKRENEGGFKSILMPIISAYVNCEESQYNYETVMDLTISQLQNAISRVRKLKHYNEVMGGVYAGTIRSKDLNLEEVNWIM